MGVLRPRQRPALRALRDPLRIRAVGRVRGDLEREGDGAEHGLDADGLTFACAMAAEERAARRAGSRTAVVGIGVSKRRARGAARLVRRRRRLSTALAVGTRDRRDARRRRGRAPCSGRARASGVAGARPGTILAIDRIVDDPAERARLRAATGADALDMESGSLARTRAPRRLPARDQRYARRVRSGRSPQAVEPDGPAPTARARCRRSLREPSATARALGDVRRALRSARRGSADGQGPARRSALVLRRSRPRDRDRRAPARASTARRSTSATTIVHNDHVVRRLEGLGAVFVDAEDEDPGRCDLRPLGARRRAGGSRELRAPRPARRRRGLPARLEGACRGAALRRQRPPRRARRSRHHVEVVGTLGERPESTVVIESPEEARALETDGKPVAVITQTTLSLDDVAPIVDALETTSARR